MLLNKRDRRLDRIQPRFNGAWGKLPFAVKAQSGSYRLQSELGARPEFSKASNK
jgi:hypothetical protein